jgi:hypothetical protein
MGRDMKYILIAVLVLLSIRPTSAGLFGPDTYEECILKNMKGVSNDVAANAVENACRNQFPKKSGKLTHYVEFCPDKTIPIPKPDERDFKFVIDYWRYVDRAFGNRFRFELSTRIYNESKKWVLVHYTATTRRKDEKPQFAREHKLTCENVLPNKIERTIRSLKENICNQYCIIEFKDFRGVTVSEYEQQKSEFLKLHPE